MSAHRCAECGKGPLHRKPTGIFRHPNDPAKRLCNACWKRLVWRPRDGAAVEHDREASRTWKRYHLGQPGRPAVRS